MSRVLSGRKERRLVPDPIYREILWDLPIGVAVIKIVHPDDPASGRILIANPAALRMKALAPQDVIGKTLSDVFPEVLGTEYPDLAARVLHTGRMLDLGLLRGFRRPDRTFAVKVFPLPQSCVGVMFEDVTNVVGRKSPD